MTRRGLTLLELLVALALTGVVAAALNGVISTAARFAATHPESVATLEEKRARHAQMDQLLSSAYLTPDATDNRAFFVAASQGSESGEIDTLSFTTLGLPQDGRTWASQAEDTFEGLHQEVGPQGGVAEVSLSTVPVGDSESARGLILRVQRPADGDPTQGGKEQVLVPEVQGMTLEFWNGVDWVTAWDTRQGDRRLPGLVRLTLATEADPQAFVVISALRHSDVTATNPSSQGAGL